jgi:2-dehydro-3-deoxygalactonokinase
MAGSTLGWAVVPYEDAPVGLERLASRLTRVEAPGPAVRIVPGVKAQGVAGAPEVMRGEETQALGWVADDLARRRGRRVLCHPGTHAKWIIVEDGEIRRFVTAMTGELYDVLRRHSVLKAEGGPVDAAAFTLGLESAGEGDGLSTRLFTVRTRVVADGLDPRSAASYLSGLLIGSEVASAPRLLGLTETGPVALVGDPALCALYETALTRRGCAPTRHDGDDAALSGLSALHRLAEEGACA